MPVFDDIFTWEGWGGKLRLASGKCRLRIFDLRSGAGHGPAPLRPMVVIVADLPESPMSVRSCAGHIATLVTARFGIDPARMQYVEYYAPSRYGPSGEFPIPERFDAVEFTWVEEKAITPRWRTLQGAPAEAVQALWRAACAAAAGDAGPRPPAGD
jgi:hypothetical protein